MKQTKQQEETPMEQLQSEILNQRLDVARNELAEVESQLALIPTQRDELVSRDELDRNALKALSTKEQELHWEQAHLSHKIAVLDGQLEKAETAEAQIRADQLPGECQALIDESQGVLQDYEKTATILIDHARHLASLQQRYLDLAQEGAWLVDRFKAMRHRLPALELPELMNRLSTEIAKAFGDVLNADAGQNVWTRKREQWAEQRAKKRGPSPRRLEAA